jgi:RNA polymerase sigma factor (sigma-70 family)
VRIDHDKVSGALYIKLRDGKYDHTEDFSQRADVYLDVDAEGNVLGLEALSFEDLAQAIEERGGKLEVPDRFGRPAEGGYDLDELRDAISSLEPRQQEALRLVCFEGLDTSEVAARLGVSYMTARRLHRTALQNLGRVLAERELGMVNDASLEALLFTLRASIHRST